MKNDDIMKELGMTEEQIDAEAAEYESGSWTGKVGEVAMGRPKLYDEDMETVSFRLPVSRIRAIDAVVSRTGQKKSDFFRDAIDKALMGT